MSLSHFFERAFFFLLGSSEFLALLSVYTYNRPEYAHTYVNEAGNYLDFDYA